VIFAVGILQASAICSSQNSSHRGIEDFSKLQSFLFQISSLAQVNFQQQQHPTARSFAAEVHVVRRTNFFLCSESLAVSFDILPNSSNRGESKQQLWYCPCSRGLCCILHQSFQQGGPVRLADIQKLTELNQENIHLDKY